ncbi:hypothetical protein ACQKK5_08030 [Brevibacillus panacihumi]|uniref:hypothetical protein n=1 Tax=Brevibacillus panacihumi TaxID=497735 RepID=UPI003D0648DA
MGTYTIDRIRHKNGTVHERELRRKGHRVNVVKLTLGSPMILEYVDSGGYLMTTEVEAYTPPEYIRGALVVQTRNSVYTLRKEVPPHREG